MQKQDLTNIKGLLMEAGNQHLIDTLDMLDPVQLEAISRMVKKLSKDMEPSHEIGQKVSDDIAALLEDNRDHVLHCRPFLNELSEEIEERVPYHELDGE